MTQTGDSGNSNCMIILASTSPYRKKLLDSVQMQFTVCAPKVDEDSLKNAFLGTTEDLILHLAQAKAESLMSEWPEDTIIGSDQMVLLNEQVLGKPLTAERAFEQLQRMQGQTHELLTAMAVVHQGQTHLHLDRTEMTMRSLSSEEIRSYVDTDQPLQCAGAYKLESAGLCLFESIKTQDHSAIVGLPILALTNLLKDLGLPLPYMRSSQ